MRPPSHAYAHTLALASVVLIGSAAGSALHRAPHLAGACAAWPPAAGAFDHPRPLGAPTGPIPVPPPFVRPGAVSRT